MAFQEARSKMHNKRLSRGFFVPPRGSQKGGKSGSKGAGDRGLEQLKARTRCRLCNQLGHWKRECPKQGQMASSSQSQQARAHFSTVYPENEQSVFPNDASAFVVVTEERDLSTSSSSSLSRCFASTSESPVGRIAGQEIEGLSCSVGSRDSLLSSQGKGSHQSRLDTSDISPVGQLHQCQDYQEVLWSGASSLLDQVLACVDTGCTRCLIGEETLRQLRKQLLAKGVSIIMQQSVCNFRFGGDYTFQAKDLAVIPCSIDSKCFSIAAYVVPGATPLLLSLPLLESWKAVIHLPKMCLKVREWQMKLPLIKSAGHLHVDLWNTLTCQDMRRQQSGRRLSHECQVYFEAGSGSRLAHYPMPTLRRPLL